jgi:hypothetical protein
MKERPILIGGKMVRPLLREEIPKAQKRHIVSERQQPAASPIRNTQLPAIAN